MGTTKKPDFRLSLHGYDREDVDTYVRTLTNERDELRHRLIELESTLDATVEYLQSRIARQSEVMRMPQSPPNSHTEDAIAAGLSPEEPKNRRSPLAVASFSTIVLVTLVLTPWAYWRGHTIVARSSVNGAAAVPAVIQSASNRRGGDIRLSRDTVPGTGSTAPIDPDRLIVSLVTRTECWIGVVIDGERRVERLLQRGEQFSVHARNELLVRVGNAGAVAFSINGRAAKALGPAGQPVTARITSANFEQFLARVTTP